MLKIVLNPGGIGILATECHSCHVSPCTLTDTCALSTFFEIQWSSHAQAERAKLGTFHRSCARFPRANPECLSIWPESAAQFQN
jgi:hypothetical protein